MTERKVIEMPRVQVGGKVLKDVNDLEQAGMAGVVLEKLGLANPLDSLDDMELTMTQADALIDSNQIVKDLFVEGHIIAICATPGGGKTTICFHLCEEITRAGYNVRFIHADVGPGEAKGMLAHAKSKGFRYITPDLNPDGKKDIGYVVKLLHEMVAQATPLDGVVFMFDTLKKMADMMSKGSVKNILTLCRKLTGLGATVILLCHTNKHKDGDGNYMFEGVGDLRADVDELIYLIPEKRADESMLVSTDPNKVRASIDPITFEIGSNREVSRHHSYVDTRASIEAKAQMEKDTDIVGVIILALKAQRIKQSEVVDWVQTYWKENRQDAKPGDKRIIAVLKRYKRGDNRQWYCQEGAQNNVLQYSLEAWF